MAGLKALKTRIESIKSTQKITSAMKMVAAANFHKSQILYSKSIYYMNNLVFSAARALYAAKLEEQEMQSEIKYPKLMQEPTNPQKYLLVVFASNSGLCGNYNALVAKEALNRIKELLDQGKSVEVICVGKKAYLPLKRKYGKIISQVIEDIPENGANYQESQRFAEMLINKFEAAEFDVCEAIYTKFVSVLHRDVKPERIIPIDINGFEYNKENQANNMDDNHAIYEFEPSGIKFLELLLPKLLNESIFQIFVNTQTSEHGARMTSMDNATRSAKEMISTLTLKYNRMRQTAITTELVEIISGAEAL